MILLLANLAAVQNEVGVILHALKFWWGVEVNRGNVYFDQPSGAFVT